MRTTAVRFQQSSFEGCSRVCSSARSLPSNSSILPSRLKKAQIRRLITKAAKATVSHRFERIRNPPKKRKIPHRTKQMAKVERNFFITMPAFPK